MFVLSENELYQPKFRVMNMRLTWFVVDLFSISKFSKHLFSPDQLCEFGIRSYLRVIPTIVFAVNRGNISVIVRI